MRRRRVGAAKRRARARLGGGGGVGMLLREGHFVVLVGGDVER